MDGSNFLFVDTNYFVAYFHIYDSLHAKALEISKTIDTDSTRLVLTNYVFLEVVTVLSQRAGKKTASTVGRHLKEAESVTIIHIDTKLHEDAWRIFQEVKAKDISFVDCSTIAAMQADSIKKILTFDHSDFKKLQKQFRFSFYPTKTL